MRDEADAMKPELTDLAPSLLDFAFDVNDVARTKMRKYVGSKVRLSCYA